LEGASTITQQVAKNFLLTNEVSVKRKIKEAILAFRIERAYSKERIMELYLNQIYLGEGTYGVAAASLEYFDKSVRDLYYEEAALLAALPRAPSKYNPYKSKERATIRRNFVLKNLYENKKLEKILSFKDLIDLSSRKKEIHLKYDLENNVNLIKFSEGKIDISFNENLGKNFVRNLSEKLLEWTGKRWVITLTKGVGQKTFSELQLINRRQLIEQEKKGEVYKKFKNIFSDGELVKVSKKD